MAVKITSYRSRVPIPATSFVIGGGGVDPESESAASVSGTALETFFQSVGMIPMR